MRRGIARLRRKRSAKFFFGRLQMPDGKFLPAPADARGRRVVPRRSRSSIGGSFRRFRAEFAHVQFRLDPRQTRQSFVLFVWRVIQANHRQPVWAKSFFRRFAFLVGFRIPFRSFERQDQQSAVLRAVRLALGSLAEIVRGGRGIVALEREQAEIDRIVVFSRSQFRRPAKAGLRGRPLALTGLRDCQVIQDFRQVGTISGLTL